MKNKDKNIIRYLTPISEEYSENLMAVMRTYVEYYEEVNKTKEVQDTLEFNEDALEKTKQFYKKNDTA